MNKTILYASLGLVLSWAGVSVVDKPLEFVVIMVIVAAIDLLNLFKN